MLSTLGYHYAVKLDNIEIVDYSKIETGLPANYEFNYKKYELRDYQEQYVKELSKNKFDVRMVDLLMGYGKAQYALTKIRVPDGWKNVEDLKVGNKVLTPNKTYTKVLGVYPQGKIDMYKITFYDKRSIEVSGNHLWEVISWRFGKDKNNESMKKVITTAEIGILMDSKRAKGSNDSALYIRLDYEIGRASCRERV